MSHFSNTTKPLVSVLIPTYNRMEYLDECLYSLLSQDYRNLEIVIRDDCSEDDTVSIVKKYEHLFNLGSNYKYKRNKTNIGYMQNMRDGLINDCSGKYAMVLNDDDFFVTDKIISIFVRMLESSQKISLVRSEAYTYLQSSKEKSPKEIIQENNNRKISLDHTVVDGNEYFLNFWSKYLPVCWASLMFRRQLALERNWAKSDCRDQGMVHLLSVGQKVVIYHDKFAYYRVHDSATRGIPNVLKRCSPEMCFASHRSIELWINCAEKYSDISKLSLFIWHLKTVILKDIGAIRRLYDQSEFKLQQFLTLVKGYSYLHYIVLKYLSPQMIRYDYDVGIKSNNWLVRLFRIITIWIRNKILNLILRIDLVLHDPEYLTRVRGKILRLFVGSDKVSRIKRKSLSLGGRYEGKED